MWRARGVFVLMVYSCSCVPRARGLLVACSWFAHARGVCDVLTVRVACSWCVNTCGLLVLVVFVMYWWCRDLFVLVV